jgi:hypothetical protein
MLHIAWDEGAIDRTFGFATSKTTKTFCEKRVKMASIDNKMPTCVACIAERDRQREMTESLLRYHGMV